MWKLILAWLRRRTARSETPRDAPVSGGVVVFDEMTTEHTETMRRASVIRAALIRSIERHKVTR